nr:CARDB domain-containing protein [Flavobacterium sp. HSC-32F16]
MKKITFLVLIFISSITSWSQTYKFHTLQDLGPNIEIAISAGCAQRVTVGPNRDVNLNQSFKLEVGKIYKSDLILGSTSGSRYYRVLYAVDYYLDKGSDIDEPANFELIPDLCNSLSWKYIRPILLGSNIQEAQANFCSNLTANTIREKVNIKTEKPLNMGDVYLMDFGKGANYYLITASDIEAGDSEYQLDPTNGNIFSPVTFNCQKPDIQAVAVGFSDYTDSYRGSKKTAAYSIRNIGSSIQSANTTFSLYLCTSRNYIDGSDTLLYTEAVSPISANGNFVSSMSFTIPNTVSNGKYYLNVKATNSEDFNVYNNIVSSPSKITIINGTPPTTPAPTPTPTPTPTGKPDLIIDPNNTIVFSDCFDCPGALSDLKGKRHRISNQAGSIKLPLISVKNIGNAQSSKTNLRFYLSSNTTLDTADQKSSGNTITINTINAGESYVMPGGSIFSTDFGNIGATFTGNWNILMVVDDSKTITESNENNNVTVIPVTFYNPFAKIAPDTLQSNLDFEDTVQPYSINVYNFEGQKVLTKEVNSKEEENKSLGSLKSGIYIIKSKNETRKVLK